VRELIAGGVVAAAAAFLAGTSGFGFGLLATPLLLVSGFSLPFVVTVNLSLSLTTRVSVVLRFRRHLHRRRALQLVLGAVPGLVLGAAVLTVVDQSVLKVGAGVLVMAVAALLLLTRGGPPPRAVPGAPVAAGFAGGFLGTTTSLLGVPPALLLARDRVATAGFFADLAVYFTVVSALGLAVLALTGELAGDALYPALVLWLPGALLGNYLGTSVGSQLPQPTFRLVSLGLVLVAGALTLAGELL